jgi:hypothetical protein
MQGNDEKCIRNHKGRDHIQYVATSRSDMKMDIKKKIFEILWTELK